MDMDTELLVKKLNNLKIKKAMFQSSGYDIPEHIQRSIDEVQKALGRVEPNPKNITNRDVGEPSKK